MTSNCAKLISPEDAGRRLGSDDHPVAIATLAWWRAMGRGPKFVKVGRRVYYRDADLAAYLETRVRNPAEVA